MRIELLLFLAFMVMIIVMIACSMPRRRSPILSPTLFPAMTLTPYNPQLMTRVGGDAAVLLTMSPPNARHSAINLSPPRCYRSASPMLTCLGFVKNVGRRSISGITLAASFISADGESREQRTFSLEQRRIEAEGIAPYRIVLPRSKNMALEIGLVSARFSALEIIALSLDNERGAYLAEEKQYHFAATLKNEDTRPARDIRLIVMLESADGAVVGYRATDLPKQLASGATIDVDLTIAPLGADIPVRHRASLDALSVSQPKLTVMPRSTQGIRPAAQSTDLSPLQHPFQ